MRTRSNDVAPIDPTETAGWPAALPAPVRRLLEYWTSKCGPDGRYPMRPDIQPGDIPDILPNIFIVECLKGEVSDYRFLLVGTAIVEVEGECTGRLLGELFADRDSYASVWAQYDGAKQGRICVRYQNLGWKGKKFIDYVTVLLPLAGEDGDCAYLIGAAVAILPPD